MYSGDMYGVESDYLTRSLFDDGDLLDSYVDGGDEFVDFDDDDATAQKLLDRFFANEGKAYFGSNAGRAPVGGHVVDGMVQNQVDNNGGDYLDDDEYNGVPHTNGLLANEWGPEDDAWLTEAYANDRKAATTAATTGSGAGAVVGQVDNDIAAKNSDDNKDKHVVGGVFGGYLCDSWAEEVLQGDNAAGRHDSGLRSWDTSSSATADHLALNQPRCVFQLGGFTIVDLVYLLFPYFINSFLVPIHADL